jgi:hypothetical protein
VERSRFQRRERAGGVVSNACLFSRFGGEGSDNGEAWHEIFR